MNPSVEKKYNELELKKYEELYSLSKQLLNNEHERFKNIEDKTQKHFTIMVVVLGFISFNIDQYLDVWKNYSNYFDLIFLILLPTMAILVLISIFFYVKALSFGKYKSLSINIEMFKHFKENRYIDVIYSLSKRNAEDLEANKNLTNSKLDNANTAFLFTKIVIVLLPITILLYSIIKLRS